ncbi:MAG: diguanylate cyclase [Microcoleaceae cyanobacterium]
MQQGESFNPKQFLILVVDDVATNLKLLRVILEPIGYSLTFAMGGHQALERVTVFKPDLILLDLMMPEMDGLEVCQRLKSNPKYADIPIIFLTANYDKTNLITAFELGAIDYISKPFNHAELLARVRNHLLLKYTIDRLKATQIELQNALTEIREIANTDPLTGILNRRSLFEIANQEFNRVNRYNLPFSILLLDLDHFKQVNDNYGHLVGDMALCAVVKKINQGIRKVDFLGRYGGEEFIAVLPETNAEQALILAERIRELVASSSIDIEKESLKLTLSIGVTSYHPNDRSIEDMISRADKGVYQAKKLGRNKCCLL